MSCGSAHLHRHRMHSNFSCSVLHATAGNFASKVHFPPCLPASQSWGHYFVARGRKAVKKKENSAKFLSSKFLVHIPTPRTYLRASSLPRTVAKAATAVESSPCYKPPAKMAARFAIKNRFATFRHLHGGRVSRPLQS